MFRGDFLRPGVSAKRRAPTRAALDVRDVSGHLRCINEIGPLVWPRDGTLGHRRPPGLERMPRNARPLVMFGARAEAGSDRVCFYIAKQEQQMAIALHEAVRIPPLVKVATAHWRVMPQIALNMQVHQELHVRRKITALMRPHHEMKVVSHDAVRQNPHRNAKRSFRRKCKERAEISGFVKERLTMIAAVDHMMNESVGHDASMARHIAQPVNNHAATAGRQTR